MTRLGDVPSSRTGAADAHVIDAAERFPRILALLSAQPSSRVVAGAADASPVIVPDSVPVPREQCLSPRVFDRLDSTNYAPLIEALNDCRTSGYGRTDLRFVVDDPELVTMHLFDTLAEFGVQLSVLAVENDHSTFFDRLSQEPTAPVSPRMTQDEFGKILEVDSAFERLLGYRDGELVGRRTSDYIHPDDLASAAIVWREVQGDPLHPRLNRLRYRTRTGDFLCFDVTIMNRLEGHGVLLSSFCDVTAEVAIQQRIAEREQLLHQLTESLPLGVAQIDATGHIRHANERLSIVLGVAIQNRIDEISVYLRPADRNALRAALQAALSGVNVDLQITVSPNNGRSRVCQVNIRCLTGDSEQGALVCVTEITAAARLREQLEHAATHDALTGCYNRQAVLDHLSTQLHSTPANDAGIAVAFVDLDLFKSTNDQHGHGAGDQVLTIVSRRLRDLLRPGDAVGRLGGDEFLVVFHDVASAADAQRLGDRIASALQGSVRLAEGVVQISASVGVSWSKRSMDTSEQMVASADAAMYCAKRAGGRHCVVAKTTVG